MENKSECFDVKNAAEQGKLRWDLLPLGTWCRWLVEVLTFGANKYAPNTWQRQTDGYESYKAAMLRHIVAWEEGEERDNESGLNHLKHAMWNACAMAWCGIMRGKSRADGNE